MLAVEDGLEHPGDCCEILHADVVRILYITSHLDDAGSYYVLKGLFSALRVLGDEVIYVNLKEARDAARGSRSPSAGGPSGNHGAAGPNARSQGKSRRARHYLHSRLPALKRIVLANLLTLGHHWRAIRETDPDVIVGRNASGGLSCVLARMKGIAYVTHMDGLQEAESSYGSKSTADYRFFLRLGRTIFKIFDAHIAVVTESVKTALMESGILPERITVLDNGVDPCLFTPDVPRHPLARRLTGKTVVGFVGSFALWHRVEEFLELVPSIIRENPSIVFLFLGRTDGGTRLENSASRANVIILDAVPQEQVPSVVACFDIGVLPFTAYSCSPLKIYEYMAMGKPAVAPRWPSIEVVIDHRQDGYLFEPDDVSALKAAILHLAGDKAERERLGRAARKKVVEQFTWAHCARRFRNACEASIASRAAPGAPQRPAAEPVRGQWNRDDAEPP